MTRGELIAHLEHLAEYVKYSEDAPALREAVEMLKCSEMPNSSEERTETRARDCISRQAAIDAYGDWYVEEGTEDGFIGTVKQLLEGLPPAQPDIIRCRDCKHWRSNTEFCSTFTELNVAHRMPPNGFCSCAERREE